MATAKLQGAILLSLNNEQVWVDEVEVEPAPTQPGTLIWYTYYAKRYVLYLDCDGEPVDTELVEYVHGRHRKPGCSTL